MYACKSGANYQKIVNFLLDKGANVDHCSSEEDTAIIWAAIGGDTEILKSILKKNPNVNSFYCTDLLFKE
jgi:ankyrin repeat protein